MTDFDVAIIGAGPAGLTLGTLLARAGIDVAVVERNDVPDTRARAITLHAPTLELFDGIGILDSLRSSAIELDRISLHANDGRSFVGDLSVIDSVWAGYWNVEQPVYESLLESAFVESGGTVLRRHAYSGHAQHQMHWVNLGLHPGWHTTAESENDLNRLGYFNGAAATTPADLPKEDVHKADMATAAHLGARVAQHAAVVLAGRKALGLA